MDLKISTITITTESNVNYDLPSIKNMDFSNHKYLSKNVLLKAADYKLFLQNKFEYGTILSIKYKDMFNGYRLIKADKNKKSNDFINQTTIDIISKNNLKISAMVFCNGGIKLAGCRSVEDALIILEIDKFFKNIKNIVINKSIRFVTLNDSIDLNQHVILVFQHMINATHYFEFEINKKVLNRIINKFNNDKFNCSYEPTGQQCVKLKIKNTSNKIYHIIKISNDGQYEFNEKILKEVESATSFTIFPLSCIISGGNYTSICKSFEQFKEVIHKYKNEIIID